MSDEINERLAEALCSHDDTMFHHDRTDDFPCTFCKEKAAALRPTVDALLAEARREAQVPAVFLADDHEGCEREKREVAQRARTEALGICAALLGKVVDYWDGRPTEHHGHHIEADLRDVLRAIEADRDHDALATEEAQR